MNGEKKTPFPVWLSPVQEKILTIADAHAEYAKKLQEEFAEKGIRVELDTRQEKINLNKQREKR